MRRFMEEAVRLALEGGAVEGGGPFGAVVVRDGTVIGRGWNRVTPSGDPTAHAEIVAIRDACRALGAFRLDGCELYSSCEPCPMCLGAIYWARLARVIYGATRGDAAAAGFDDSLIYRELALPPGERAIPMTQLLRDEALESFRRWGELEGRTPY